MRVVDSVCDSCMGSQGFILFSRVFKSGHLQLERGSIVRPQRGWHRVDRDFFRLGLAEPYLIMLKRNGPLNKHSKDHPQRSLSWSVSPP